VYIGQQTHARGFPQTPPRGCPQLAGARAGEETQAHDTRCLQLADLLARAYLRHLALRQTSPPGLPRTSVDAVTADSGPGSTRENPLDVIGGPE
jgi:hypothetical protein